MCLAIVLCSQQVTLGQSLYTKDLPSFTKVMISSHINATLIKGDSNSIEVDYSNTDIDRLNIQVHGKTLKVYVDESKIWPKSQKIKTEGNKKKCAINKGVNVEVTIYYTVLNSIEKRGEEDLICNSALYAKDFKLSLFGESTLVLDTLKCSKVKIRAFGENDIEIKNGEFSTLKVSGFGENSINTKNVKSEKIHSILFGENKIKCYCEKLLRVSSFGESDFIWKGSGRLHRILVFGENDFYNKEQTVNNL
jgi:hypothetical protein